MQLIIGRRWDTSPIALNASLFQYAYIYENHNLVHPVTAHLVFAGQVSELHFALTENEGEDFEAPYLALLDALCDSSQTRIDLTEIFGGPALN
ncbi:hypothetical protein [Kocuria marina]|uniref:hypothetical protein n=1 Tax=Kocuria marina TaxID=223184 RepID=UPI0022E8F6A2|nr:hypothetical protein [Kocuria marina]